MDFVRSEYTKENRRKGISLAQFLAWEAFCQDCAEDCSGCGVYLDFLSSRPMED